MLRENLLSTSCFSWLLIVLALPVAAEQVVYQDIGAAANASQFISAEVAQSQFLPINDPILTSPMRGQKIKFLADGILLNRDFGAAPQTLLVDAPFPQPSNELLNTSDLDYDVLVSARLELVLYDEGPNPIDYKFGYQRTEEAEFREVRMSNPADVRFFGGVAANPSNSYVARGTSQFRIGDFGLRKQFTSRLAGSASVSLGEFKEEFDLLSAENPVATGFFSRTENDLYGFQLGGEALLWTNGVSRIEANLNGGVYYNDIEVQAVALNIQRFWSDSSAAFAGSSNIALVIPAFPFDIRVGYQANFLSGVAMAADQSTAFSFFTPDGSAATSDLIYHGFFLGLEFVR